MTMNIQEQCGLYKDFGTTLLASLTIEDALQKLCLHLVRLLPSDRVVLYAADAQARTADVIVDYAPGGDMRSYQGRLAGSMDKGAWEKLRLAGCGDVFLCARAAAHEDAYAFLRGTMGAAYNSFVALRLEGARDGKTRMLFFLSFDPSRYSERDAGVLASFRPFAEEILGRLGQAGQDVALAMAGRKAVDVSAEKLLRRCPGLAKTMRQVEIAAGADVPVLLHGESGAGKELVAETLHALSPWREGPLVKVNCSALTEALLDSELFGHEKGAFTGAVAGHAGFFEQASGGTLFLDEVAELSPQAQARLLRAAERGEVRRVGGTRSIPVRVRIIAATNENIWQKVREGRFREDLCYRLDGFTVEVPPLRERPEDIPLLAEYFYRLAVRNDAPGTSPSLTRDFVHALQRMPWPGNVRQLRRAVERAVIVSRAAGLKSLEAAPQDRMPSQEEASRERSGRRGRPAAPMPDKGEVERALKESGWRIQGAGGAAARLGLPPSTLRKCMRQLGLPLPSEWAPAGRTRDRRA